MSSNTNLFYNLYSTSNNVTNAGYICSSAVDEEDTSFDITASSLGSAGTITDSNGKTLANIDLSQLHAAGITQYNNETRILQPYACYLLQGQEYGLSRATYYFKIPPKISRVKEYEKYLTVDFDVIYNNFDPKVFHICSKADGEESFINLVNDELSNSGVEVSVSIHQIKNNNGVLQDYIVFLAQDQGYFYYINNLRLVPEFQSEDYPESPFSKNLVGMKTIIFDFIKQFHPVKIGEEYVEDEYDVDCELYKWALENTQKAIDSLQVFKDAIDMLKNSEWSEADIAKFNQMIKDTPYDDPIFNGTYDIENLELVGSIIESINALIIEADDFFENMYWLFEDKSLRIPLMKYPNGAFRGIVLIPDWPSKNPENYEYKSVWINHVKSMVTIYRPTADGHYMPKKYGVLSNATLTCEQDEFKHSIHDFNGVQSNISLVKNLTDGWYDNNNVFNEFGDKYFTQQSSFDTDYIDPYRPSNSVYEDTIYMGQNCYDKKENVIGLFRYMQFVNENSLWDKVGQGYIIVGNPDDPQSQTLNLPTSLLIYNPNPSPLRIKYMIFS